MAREAAHRQIEDNHVALTGSDDFAVPAVARKVRSLAGLHTATPDELLARAERAVEEGDLSPEAKIARINELRELMG